MNHEYGPVGGRSWQEAWEEEFAKIRKDIAATEIAATGNLAKVPAKESAATGNLAEVPTEDLFARVKTLDQEIRAKTKALKEADKEITAKRWERGQYLMELKRRLGHGKYLPALKERRIHHQRASEDARIAAHFKTAAEAGQYTGNQALRLIRKAADMDTQCFATPEWLQQAVIETFGFPALDVAASDDCHFGDVWYTLEQDGLKQDWGKDCKGGIIFMNCPYNMGVLPEWVEMAWRVAQKGYTVVCLLPFWRYPWLDDFVKKYGEVWLLDKYVIAEGFGPCEGQQARKAEREHLLVVFRKGQKGSLKGWFGS